MKIEFAVTGPSDIHCPNAIYVWNGRGLSGAAFYRLGGDNNSSREYLTQRDAQFHTVDVPDWVAPPKDQAIAKLDELAHELDGSWLFAGTADKARKIRDLVREIN